MTSSVLIVGAGPTGLMLALSLVKQGINIRIIDAKAGPVEETRAIVVQARTLEFYAQLGLIDEALQLGNPIQSVSYWAKGKQTGTVQLQGLLDSTTPYPYLLILTQDQNELLLLRHLARLGVSVEQQTRLITLEQTDTQIQATLLHGDQREEQVVVDYLIGCDGGSSTVRQQLNIPFNGDTQSQLFFVADVGLKGVLNTGQAHLCFDEDDVLALFPMRHLGEGRYRAVGIVPSTATVNQGFAAVRPVIEQHQLATVVDKYWFSTYRIHHRVAETFQQGRVFLAGDACHIHSPIGGQGMNAGLGDAVNLAWKLAQTLRGPSSGDLLSTYSIERLPFAKGLVHTTDKGFNFLTKQSTLANVVRSSVLPHTLPRLLRFKPLGKRAFATLSELNLSYPNSPLSQNFTDSPLQAGQRLPWLKTELLDNYQSLQQLNWQVHSYGAPIPDALRTWCEQQAVALLQFKAPTKALQATDLSAELLYLIRPDGHIGLITQGFYAEAWQNYAQQWF